MTKNIIRNQIAERLRQARIQAGFSSARAFCEAHKLCIATYTAHELGLTPMKASQALSYCKLLRISLDAIFMETEPQ